jgi:hypothetical protein
MMKLSKLLFSEAAIPFGDIAQSEIALRIFRVGGRTTLVLYRPSALTKYFRTWEQEDLDLLVVGMINLVVSEESNRIYEVKAIAAESGYGPVMYDIAMSYIAPKYLMADRMDVSAAARRVWAHTFENRLSEYDTISVGKNSKWKDRGGKELPSLNFAYRLKKKLPIYSSVAIKDSRFFAQEPNSNKREHMLTTLEEQAWTYFRDRMQEQ